MPEQITPTLNERFATNLRGLRQRLGLTQAQFAEKVGMHQPTIAAMEAGRNSPTLKTVQQIADAIEVESSELLC